jgi:pimeloyl-ACP methyl ester carboxylesterase
MTESAIKAFPPIYEALTNPQKKKVVVVAHSQGTIIMAYVLRLLKGQWPETEGVKMLRPKKSRVVAVGPEPLYTPVEPVFVYPNQTPLKPSDFRPVTAEELAKLEIYCFANCARRMTYFDKKARVPWIESIGNEHDLVARLGMLAPHPEERQIAIDGPRYVHKDTWGHLLNVHYLYDIDKHEQGKGRQPGGSGDGTFKGTLQLLNTAQFPDEPTPRLFKYINGGHTSPLSPPQ